MYSGEVMVHTDSGSVWLVSGKEVGGAMKLSKVQRPGLFPHSRKKKRCGGGGGGGGGGGEEEIILSL